MENKFAAFDLGNVVLEIDFTSFENAWESLNYHQTEHYMDFLNDLHGQQDVGLTTVMRHLKERFNTPLFDIEYMQKSWDSIIKPNQQMLNFIDKLEKNGVKIAILSNIGTEHAKLIRAEFPEIFANKILHLSCEVGARKPTKLYYQSFLIDHPEFKGCVYLDDLEENCKMGEFYGFNSIKFELNKEFNNGEVSSNKLDMLYKKIME